tara:strand:- start:559 stop:846 length:288 start_codon:yes stop_codon:yes gene_type:complete
MMVHDSEKTIKYTGFEKAEIGIGYRCGQPDIIVYDYEIVLECLRADGMDDEEAQEWMDYNILGGWIGEQTPIIVRRPEHEAEVREREDVSSGNEI